MAPSRFIAVFSQNPASLFESAHRLSPKVEKYSSSGLVIEVPPRYEQETLNRLSSLLGRDDRIGGASTRTAAILAAQFHSGTLVPYGRESIFAAPLPVRALSLFVEVDKTHFSVFSGWGIRTLGELAELPGNALVTRFGQQAEVLQELARGRDPYHLPVSRPEPEFREVRRFDWAVDLLDPLIFAAGSMLESLCGRLEGRGLGVERLCLYFELARGEPFQHELKLAFPMQDPRVILSLLRLELQARPPAAPVLSFVLQAIAAKPRRWQGSLLQPAIPHPEKLARTLTRLKGILGRENVGTPRMIDSHRPDAFRLEEFSSVRPESGSGKSRSEVEKERLYLSLRRVRPPRPMELRAEEILFCAGPWKSSGNWWANEPGEEWAHEEWDVELTDGGIYCIFWDQYSRGWFKGGVYD